MNRAQLAFTLILATIFSATAGELNIIGTIGTNSGKPAEFANISVPFTTYGTATDENGKYALTLESDTAVTIVVSYTGFSPITRRIEKSGTYNFTLEPTTMAISEVKVGNKREREINQMRIDPKLLKSLPGTSLGGIETTIKTLPGVTSNSELSNQYNVRGGNFDENLIYINNIKVYRPILVRNGQQEGLSFVNPDLVSNLSFSSGGFDATYGDKMSSVLDISYKKPHKNAGGFSANFLGANAYFDGCTKNKKFSSTTGIRYRNTSLLLKSLEEGGTYKPIFFDLQSYWTYKLSEKITTSFFLYGSSNSYEFTPVKRQSKFIQDGQYYDMTIYFKGKEHDTYTTALASGAIQYSFNKNTKTDIGYAHYSSNEKELFDIEASYLINQSNPDTGADFADEEIKDSEEPLASGNYLNHARNYLFIETNTANAIFTHTKENYQIKAGTGIEVNTFESRQKEWKYIDSADYSRPYSENVIQLNDYKKVTGTTHNTESASFLQFRYRLYIGAAEVSTTAGIRHIYSSLIDEHNIAPRGRISIKPDWERDFLFRVSGGIYHQTPRYKEFIAPDGTMYTDISAQESYHIVAGLDHNLRIWGRPFKLVTELYYKHFTNIIPYTVDNVRMQYYPTQTAKGYARGADLKLNGEFVKGTESWMSVSLLDTQEDIDGDNLGYVRRPTDRLLNFGLFFQDYLPRNDSYKMNLTLYYGTALPTIPPGETREALDIYNLPDYQRVDLGFLKQIFPTKKGVTKAKMESFWIGVEVFNLLDKSNTISYLWINDIHGKSWPIPNYLTSRRLNVTLSGKF